jgi:hypothetical protein
MVEIIERKRLPWHLRWRYGLIAASIVLFALSAFGGVIGLPRLLLAFIWTPLPFCLVGLLATFL